MKRIKNSQIFLSLILIVIIITSLFIFLIWKTPQIKTIKISEKINENNTKTITVKLHNPLNQKIECGINTVKETNNVEWKEAENNICNFNLNSGDYYIFIRNENKKILSYKTKSITINEIIGIKTPREKIYLTLGETYNLLAEVISIGDTDNTLSFKVIDEQIISLDNTLITPLQNGTTTIEITTTNNIKKEITVIVTDLYKKASLDNNTVKLSCNVYNTEEARMLDEILEQKIEDAGNSTRGAVVTAARFLILEFPYQIAYFFENGRLNNYDGKAYVDGEGRYYKKGLYLNEEKFNTLLASSKYGPAIWGCPLTNWQNEYGYVPGVKYPNGLDCSGFVSWVLFNAGFDVGDSGAGDTYRDDDIGDLGTKHELTKDFVNSGAYKVGDLIGRDGHIAIIAGLDDDNIYIAESLVGGVVIKQFPKNGTKLYQLYSFINTMDEIYINEGNYTNMW